jgi:proline iminopeptidase
MKLLILVVVQFFLLSVSSAQKMDSVKYEHGYLYFHEYGKGEPIILLTGGPGAGHLQLEEVAINLGKTHRSILLEQRGTGRSMPKPYNASTVNIKAAMTDLNLLLDHLKLQQAHFLGHSWGSMLAMNYASTYPERIKSLILISSGPYKLDRTFSQVYAANREARLTPDDKKGRDIALQKMRQPNATAGDKENYYRWELVPVIYERGQVDSLQIKINKGGLNPETGSFLFQSLAKEQIDVSTKLPTLNKPIHIVCGAQDPGGFISYETKLILPKAKLYWINEAGHFPMYERPEKFYSVLQEILTQK